jgi:phosphohistidine phosphatase
VRLIIVRHAIAVQRGTSGIPDDERPLTPEGEKRFRQAARGLTRIASRPKRLLTSPGGDFEDLAAALDRHAPDDIVAVFGHEPQLSELLARLVTARDDACLAFRKGGAALVDLPGGLAQGGRLIWFLPPRVLRQLGK